MKILYQHRTQAADGGYVHIRELTEALKALGHEVIMVGPAFPEGGKFNEDSNSAVSTLRRFIPRPVYELMEYAYSFVAFRRLWKAYKEHKPDVYYERYNLFFLPGVWLKKRTGIPMLLEVNAPLYQERCAHSGGLTLKSLAKSTERAAWKAADMVLPVTDVLADHIRAEGIDEHRIEVIANGVGREFLEESFDGTTIRERYGIAPDALVLGFTGFVRPWHGLDRILDMIAAHPDRDRLHLLMVGDGPARVDLEAQAKSLGIGNRVSFTGVVNRGDIPSHIAAFDIALQPSVVAYASPLKLFEYLAMSKAVAAPDTPNIREVLTHQENALLFDPNQPEGLSQAVQALIDDPTLRQKLGQAGRALIETRPYTWSGNARRVIELFEKFV